MHWAQIIYCAALNLGPHSQCSLKEIPMFHLIMNIVDVQSYWNSMEQRMVELADLVATVEEFSNHQSTKSNKVQ